MLGVDLLCSIRTELHLMMTSAIMKVFKPLPEAKNTLISHDFFFPQKIFDLTLWLNLIKCFFLLFCFPCTPPKAKSIGHGSEWIRRMSHCGE